MQRLFYTIGYESVSIADFITELFKNNIEVLLDVRAIPHSRKLGFSKNKIQIYLREYGISYVHLKELGDPKPGRDAARSGEYAKFYRIYSQHLATCEAKAALVEVSSISLAQTACLMCFERDHNVCHRNLIANWLTENTDMQARHLAAPRSAKAVGKGQAGGANADRGSSSVGQGITTC